MLQPELRIRIAGGGGGNLPVQCTFELYLSEKLAKPVLQKIRQILSQGKSASWIPFNSLSLPVEAGRVEGGGGGSVPCDKGAFNSFPLPFGKLSGGLLLYLAPLRQVRLVPNLTIKMSSFNSAFLGEVRNYVYRFPAQKLSK